MSTKVIHVPSGAAGVTIDVSFQQNAGAGNPGNPLTGVLFNTGSFTCNWSTALTAPTPITLVTQTPTGGWTSGGFVARGSGMPGNYRFDLPNGLIPADGELNIVFDGASGLATHTLTIIPTQRLFHGILAAGQFAATGVQPTPEQALKMLISALFDFNGSGANVNFYDRDNATQVMQGTFQGTVGSETGLLQTT